MHNAYGAVRLGVLIGFTIWLAGCGGGGASIASSVGNYGTPPPGAAKARVGLTPLKVETPTTHPSAVAGVSDLGDIAADELATLLAKSGRFDIVGRIALKQSLEQQGLADAVQAGALVHPAKVNGVDYVMVGSLSNLSVTKRPATPSTFGKMKSWVQQSTQNKQVQVAATCNVGIKLIEPATGDVMLSNNTQFARTGAASSMGLDVLQVSASESGELPVSEDDREQIVRLALDDAVRKSLPKIDRFLQSRGGLEKISPTTQPTTARPSSATVTTPPTPAPAARTQPPAPAPAATPASTAMKICPNCGAANDPAAKFCKKCGGNL